MKPARAIRIGVLGPMAYWGFVSSINGAVAPFLAESFSLSDAAIARALGWIGFACLAALALGRSADRMGRRRSVLLCCGAIPVAAAASALAPGLRSYVAAQLLVYGFGMTLLSALVVSASEHTDEGGRAKGQGWAGLAYTAGTTVSLALAVLCSGFEDAWRWVWAAAVLPLGAWRLLARHLPESRAWQRAAGRGETAEVSLLDVFLPRYRRRALSVLAGLVAVSAAEFAVRTWLFYHPVRSLHVAPAAVFVLLGAGGAVGLAGFALGGRLAEAWGRRASFVAGATCFALGTATYYGATTKTHGDPLPLLAVGFVALAAGGNVATVAFRTAATELFPTRLRGRLGGWMAVSGACGWLLAMFGASALASRLGSLGLAVTVLVALCVAAASLLVSTLPETAGLALEVASLDDPAASALEGTA